MQDAREKNERLFILGSFDVIEALVVFWLCSVGGDMLLYCNFII
ncbi:hypothetical protein [Leptospira noguchii]|nr:hypothetical protein [Leptospira noguchii]